MTDTARAEHEKLKQALEAEQEGLRTYLLAKQTQLRTTYESCAARSQPILDHYGAPLAEIREGFTIQAGGFWSYYYTAAGLHAFHVLCGMIIMLVVAQTASKNQELHRVENIGIYWHFVDVVWIFLFPLLYIAK